MKRILILLLAIALCLTGCKKKQTDLPGAEEVPEGIDWNYLSTVFYPFPAAYQ